MQLQKALSILYPAQCVACGTLVEEAHALCGACWVKTPFIDGLVCDACGVPLLGEAAGARPLCDDCMTAPRPWEKGRAVLVYRDNARRIVLSLKHADRIDLVRPAARWMATRVPALLPADGVIVPVPLHWTRLLTRRFNQAALLARAIGKISEHKVIPDALIRRRRTAVQEHMTREERTRNLDGAMMANPMRVRALAGKPLLLVDDVFTSGATFGEATRAARAAGISSVSVLALARVVKDA